VTEKRFRELLEQQAEAIISDIRGDREANGDEPLDYGYECYANPVPLPLQAEVCSDLIGAVYAGDLGTWFFTPDGEGIGMFGIDRTLAAQVMPRVFGPAGIYSYEGF
jgi:hypothetical protein